MKRKIALLLAAIMTIAAIPMNVMADSSTSLNRTGMTFKSNKVVVRYADIDVPSGPYPEDAFTSAEPISLDIRPTTGKIEQGEKIILRMGNGKFDRRLIEQFPDLYTYHVAGSGEDWNTLMDQMHYIDAEEVLRRTVSPSGSNAMPYNITIYNDEEAEVELFPLPAKYVNMNGSIVNGYPTYKILLPVTTLDSAEGDMTISIDGNGTTISDVNDRKVATVWDSPGSTTASVIQSQVKTFSSDTHVLPDITLKEDMPGTFDSQNISLTINGNYEITNIGTARTGVNVHNPSEFAVTKMNDSTIIIHLKDAALHPDGSRNVFDSDNLSTIVISGITIRAKTSDTYGDVNVTISGDAGISNQTVKVAERRAGGFSLWTLGEPPVIVSGKTPLSFVVESDVENFATAEFEFGEVAPESWQADKALEFSVPAGVKIVGYEVTKRRNFINSADLFSTATIINNGTTLRFEPVNIYDNAHPNGTDPAYFDLKLYLTAQIGFSGDVTVSASGAGANALSPVVVAKFVSPVTVATSSTRAGAGNKSVKTADIKLTENAAGALTQGDYVEIFLDNTNLKFDGSSLSYKTDGELKIKDLAASSNIIRFTVDTASYTQPSSVTISGITISSDSDIPYGSYTVKVGGTAAVDNYKENVNSALNVAVSSGVIEQRTDETADYDKFEVDAMDFNNYLQISDGSSSENPSQPTTSSGGGGQGPSSGGGGGGGGGGSSKKATTTESTTEATTASAESSTETTTAKTDKATGNEVKSSETVTIPEVKVSIGSQIISINGKSFDMGVAPYIQASSSSTLVPLRFVAVVLSGDDITNAENSKAISWNAVTKQATVSIGENKAVFTSGSGTVEINGVAAPMENGVVAEIRDSRMFVPFRAIGTILGVNVEWDANTKTAMYKSK